MSSLKFVQLKVISSAARLKVVPGISGCDTSDMNISIQASALTRWSESCYVVVVVLIDFSIMISLTLTAHASEGCCSHPVCHSVDRYLSTSDLTNHCVLNLD